MLRLRFTHALVAAGLSLGLTAVAAVPASAAPAAPAAPSTSQYYTVVSGDYLMGIAAKLGVSLTDLLAANNLTSSSLIYPGMKLVVPGSAGAAPTAPVTQYYTVASGDYLTGIAVKLSVKLSALLEANRLTIQSVILPGQRLVVPAGGSLPSASPSAPSGGAATGPVSTAAQPLVYTVVSGDYLSGISLKLKVRLGDLLTLNRLTTTSLIYPGMTLQVPPGGVLPSAGQGSTGSPGSSGTTSAASSNGLIYVVRSGDSLSGIASATKVSLRDLLAVNHLAITSIILPGQQLAIPAGGVLPSSSSSSASGASGSSGAVSPRVATVLDFARAQEGKPYAFNTAGPDTYDCSGLTLAAFAKIGINLPHYSGYQVRYGTAVDWNSQAIRPGDLVFLESSPGSGVINHVGIAVSATSYIHAPRSGDVVRVGAIPFYRVVAVQRLVQD